MMLWYLYIHRKTTSFGGRVKLAKRTNLRSKEERSKDTILVIMTVRKMYIHVPTFH